MDRRVAVVGMMCEESDGEKWIGVLLTIWLWLLEDR
jgi:hypothetical protein